jgi:hypothetical protein
MLQEYHCNKVPQFSEIYYAFIQDRKVSDTCVGHASLFRSSPCFFFTSLAHDRVQCLGTVERRNAHTKFRGYRLTVSEVQMGRMHVRAHARLHSRPRYVT